MLVILTHFYFEIVVDNIFEKCNTIIAKGQKEELKTMSFYKPIKRRYFETMSIYRQSKMGTFIARGQWADGHLAYTRIDENGEEVEDCSYVQLRGKLKQSDGSYKSCLYMQRI